MEFLMVTLFVTHVKLLLQIIKINPFSGEIVCTIQLLATAVTNLCFGRCPGSRAGDPLACIYATTAASIDPTNPYNGFVFLIEGVGSIGVEPNKVRYNKVFGG